MRHAQATSVSVIMHRRADALQLIVEDDGIGFDARLERQRPYVERRLGLMGMEERVAQLAGTLTIESTPGSGTTLFVSLPLARAAQKGPVVTLQIFLADDHLVVREGLKTLINAQHDMCVIGEASDGQTVVQQARDCQPDLVIMDISMPKMNGVQATAALKRACPDIKVLALSAHEDVTYLRELLAVGASGYLLKHAAADTLIQAIHQVAAGGLYLEPSLSKHVVARFVRVPAANDMLGADLSERETEVAQRVAQGYSNQDIANQLTLSVKTVETYRGRAMKKLGLESRAALVRYALEHGWLRAS
jgi:DNA-binding NarL/FixJ family response regulator